MAKRGDSDVIRILLLGIPIIISGIMVASGIKIQMEGKMKNRIKDFYKDIKEEDVKKEGIKEKKPPKLTQGQWVTVHLCFGGSIAESEDDISGIHVVIGKMALSETVIQRVEEGIYGEVESMSMRIETEDS